MVFMSLIACTDPCVYQQDGLCVLARAASGGGSGLSRCVNFVPRSQQSGQRLPDVGHPDDLQARRDTQLTVDPLGDQAFGETQTGDLA